MQKVRKLKKRPVEIEGIRFTYESARDIANWASDHSGDQPLFFFNHGYDDKDLWGQVYDVLHDTWINVYPGQWILKGVDGEFYPCDNEVLHKTYLDVTPEDSDGKASGGQTTTDITGFTVNNDCIATTIPMNEEDK